ncbi:hypothetical protein EDD18DRAFT_834648 [Armillaria luteobubalina]|uniref:Uncharacterized protein n=1 Tax=Armillaria luteobubalina TaxID=153913 RepID=A0AA39PA90_9AGAR|nr:hypothetical protein EDD18DRAFT_834648 [Armillaria luteobubalina]
MISGEKKEALLTVGGITSATQIPDAGHLVSPPGRDIYIPTAVQRNGPRLMISAVRGGPSPRMVCSRSFLTCGNDDTSATICIQSSSIRKRRSWQGRHPSNSLLGINLLCFMHIFSLHRRCWRIYLNAVDCLPSLVARRYMCVVVLPILIEPYFSGITLVGDASQRLRLSTHLLGIVSSGHDSESRSPGVNLWMVRQRRTGRLSIRVFVSPP